MFQLDDSYLKEANEKWGGTAAYAEFSAKAKTRSAADFQKINEGLDAVMGEFAAHMARGLRPDDAETRALVGRLQEYISEHYYTCTNEILFGLGQMYAADERFRQNIDRHGDGAALYIREAIEAFCRA